MARKRSPARLLLDTSAVVHLLHGHTLHKATVREAIAGGQVLVPVFVRMEYLRGVVVNLIEMWCLIRESVTLDDAFIDWSQKMRQERKLKVILMTVPRWRGGQDDSRSRDVTLRRLGELILGWIRDFDQTFPSPPDDPLSCQLGRLTVPVEGYDDDHPRLLPGKSKSLTAGELIDLLLEWVQKHRSERTYSTRRTYCSRFASFRVGGHGGNGGKLIADLPTNRIKSSDMEAWLDHLAVQGHGPQTRKHAQTSVKHCWNWATKHPSPTPHLSPTYRPFSGVEAVHVPAKALTENDLITDAEVQTLFKAAEIDLDQFHRNGPKTLRAPEDNPYRGVRGRATGPSQGCDRRCEPAGDVGDLERVRQPGADGVVRLQREHLGLVLEAADRG